MLLGVQDKEEAMGTMRKKAGRGREDSGDSCHPTCTGGKSFKNEWSPGSDALGSSYDIRTQGCY